MNDRGIDVPVNVSIETGNPSLPVGLRAGWLVGSFMGEVEPS